MVIVVFHYIIVSADTTATTKSSEEHHTEYEDPFKVGLNPERDYLILVNGKHEYQFDGDYDQALQNDLIYVSNVYGDPVQIEKGANLAFTLLKNYLREEGIDIDLFSCYRTKAEQQWFCDQSSGFDPRMTIDNLIDVPGYSERHTGLLLHIKVRQQIGETDDYIWASEFFEAQSDNPTFKKVHESLARFGFIMRYPNGKEDITGSPYRPYEIRFVGSSEVAHIITNNKLTLEEYLKNKKKYSK